MVNNPFVRLDTALSVGPPALALLLWQKRTEQDTDTYGQILHLHREARLRPRGLSISESFTRVRTEHCVGGLGCYRTSLDTRRNHYIYNRLIPTLDPKLAKTFTLDNRGEEIDSNMAANTQNPREKVLNSPGSEVKQARTNETITERAPIPLRISSLAVQNGASLYHRNPLAAVQTPSFLVVTPPRHRPRGLNKKTLNHEYGQTPGSPGPSTTPEGSPPALSDERLSSLTHHMLGEDGEDVTELHSSLYDHRADTLTDGVLWRRSRLLSLSGFSDDGINDFDISGGRIDAVKVDFQPNSELDTGKAFMVPKEVSTTARKGGDHTSRLFRDMLATKYKVSELPNQDPFRDSGYETPTKPDGGETMVLQGSNENDKLVAAETPSKSGPRDNEDGLSLMLTPSKTSSLAPDLSPNQVDNLTTKFAKRARRYLELGHEYVVGQSNEEIDAQRSYTAHARSEPLSVNISDILTRVCLCNPQLEGTPIVKHSQNFQSPTAAMEKDDCMLLNMPEDHNGYVLRIESREDGRMVYHLDLSMPLMGSADGADTLIIVSQVDITSAVEQLAIQEHHARSVPSRSAKSFNLEPNDWIEQAVIESNPEQGPVKHEEKSPFPPSLHMRRLLAFIQTLIREHLECCVFAGKKDVGWEHINWKVHHISAQLYEPGERPIYEKGVDEDVWLSIAHHMDESEDGDGFRWPQTISWGETGDPRLGYFVPITDGRGIDDKQREKWWLMVLSDFDEDIWRTERIV